MTVKFGVTRIVLLVGSWAVKFPSVASWRLFLTGLLANIHEALWYRGGVGRSISLAKRDPRLCPILLVAPLGLFLVMRRAQPLPDRAPVDWSYFAGLPQDRNPRNVGLLNNRLVLIDYGN